jgi:hypothetical protein
MTPATIELKIKVDGTPIGGIAMTPKGYLTEVVGELLIQGEYSMNPNEIRNMLLKKVQKDYKGHKIAVA